MRRLSSPPPKEPSSSPRCGACACRLLGGRVDLMHNEVLEEEDFAEGYILACQAVARTESVSVTYY